MGSKKGDASPGVFGEKTWTHPELLHTDLREEAMHVPTGMQIDISPILQALQLMSVAHWPMQVIITDNFAGFAFPARFTEAAWRANLAPSG